VSQDLSLNVGANTTGFNAAMTQAAVLTEAQMKRIAQYIKSGSSEVKNLAAAANSAAASSSAAYEKIAANADTVSHAHAGMTRELIVLGHELSQGNLKRFGGSLLVLAEYSPRAQAAISALMGPIGGLIAIVGIAGVAMIEGALDAEKFAKSLQLTGNYAALTQSSLEELAKTQAAQTGQSRSGARGTIEAAAGSGVFGPAAIAPASRAMGDYQRVTGEAAEDVLGKFKSIQDGVAKWAEEQNKQMHFLTLGEYDRIKALEESGQKEQAAIETLNLLSTTMESRATPATGALAAIWKVLKESVQDAGAALMDIGKPSTLNDSINAVKRQIGDLQSGNSGGSYVERQRQLVPLQAELLVLTQQQFKAMDHLTDSAYAAMRAEEGIAGQKGAEEWIKRGKAVSEYTKALDKFHADAKAAADAGKPFTPAEINSGEGAIKKQFTDHSAVAQSDEYKNLQATIKAFNTTTDEEINRMGKLTAGQKFSIQAHEELTKAGKKLSDQQRATIASAIDEAAAHRTVADMLLAAQKATIARVQADTANQQQQQGLVEGVIQSGNDQANAILRQSQLIGKSADEALKIQELQKFDDLVGKALLGADNDTAARINEVAKSIRSNLVSAIDDAKKAQDDYNASFTNGWDKAQKDYVKQASNSAAWGEKVFNDSTSSMSNAITQFAETGKLSFDGLVKTIIDDLIKMEVQQGFAALFGSGTTAGLASGFLGSIGKFFGAGTSTAPGAATAYGGDYSTAGLAAAFGYANGIDYVPHDGFMAVLHEGEKVTRRQDAAVERNSGGAPNFDFSGAQYSFAAGVDASTMAQYVKTSQAQTKAEIHRALSTNGRF
jgi:lambda family phage tail tape measure protein